MLCSKLTIKCAMTATKKINDKMREFTESRIFIMSIKLQKEQKNKNKQKKKEKKKEKKKKKGTTT